MIDFISEMPNDVLVHLLSLLPLKLAVSTCILSKRWRFVWSCLKRLDFDGSESLERATYINQVNSLIGSHGSPVIELFRIYFNLDNTCSEDIDNWLRFAFHKKVKDLQLDFSKSSFMTELQYDFPLPSSDGNVEDLNIDAIPALPKVKTLKLTLPTQQYDCLVEFIEIARRVRFWKLILSLHWSLPITRIKAWSHTIQFPHLAHLVIEGYLGGLSSDFLIAKYMIANAMCKLRQIDIDPYCEDILAGTVYSWESKATGRFNAISDLPSIVPSWIHLVIH